MCEPSSDPFTFTVTQEYEGLRLDHFLVRNHPNFSRTFCQKCIEAGHATVNSATQVPAYRLEIGDVVVFNPPEPQSLQPQAEDIPLDIIYEDEAMMVVNKAAGLVVHPAPGNLTGTLVSGLLNYAPELFQDLADDGVECRPGIVHRLDKDTSGALVIAKTADAAAKLKASFKDRSVTKLYLTAVRGVIHEESGCIADPIGRDPENRMRMAVVSNGKEALTKFKVISKTREATLLLVRLYTGRTHQIRVHFSNLGHPVLGDTIYGPKRPLPEYPCQRQMLHAWKMALPHPQTGEELRCTAALPQDFRDLLKKFPGSEFFIGQ